MNLEIDCINSRIIMCIFSIKKLLKPSIECSRTWQGALQTEIKYLGLYFFKLASGPGLTNYVSRHLSIYGNSISNICMIR